MKIKISLAQINIKHCDIKSNMDKAEAMIRDAKKVGSDLILLPELWSSGYDLANVNQYINPNRVIQSRFNELSTLYNLAIAGSLIEEKNHKYYNTLSICLPGNETPCQYKKIHLIPQLDEEKWLSPGNELSICEINNFQVGLVICYDIRFPELIRKYTLKGVDLVIVVAEWPLSRIDHWITLLRARAIENQIYIAAVNSVGETGKMILGGHSCIITPWGKILITGNEHQEDLLSADIFLSEIKKIRESFPVLENRREDVY